MAVKLIVVLADLHSGHKVAVMPPTHETAEGDTLYANDTQKMLYDLWMDATQEWLPSIIGKSKYAVVVNGDAVEGVHHGGKELVINDQGEHARIAMDLLRPITQKAVNRFMVLGTECHTQNTEAKIAASLGFDKHPEGGYAANRWVVNLNGFNCVFRHHIGTSSRIALYGSQLGIHLAEEQSQAARYGGPMPNGLFCAHRHTFTVHRDDRALCVTSPPWKLLDRHTHKVAGGSRSGVGLYVLDARNKAEGEAPEVHARVYRPKPDKVVSI